MSNSNTLELRIEVDDKGSIKVRSLGKDLEQTGRAAEKAGTSGERGFAKFRTTLNDIDKSGKVTLGTFTQLAAGAAAFGAIATAAMTALLLRSTQAASNLSETTNKFNTVFAGMTDQANAWASELQSSYGMSKNASMDMLASLQVLNQGMGMTQGQAGKLSSDMVKLAVDLGSFHNLPTVDVLEAIRSAIVGEYDPIQRFAGAINAATVEQKALAMGLAKSKDELTAAAKAQAMYQLVVESNSAALGDYGRTVDGLANQTKQYQNNIEDLSAAFGARLEPVAADVLKKINEGMKNSEGGVVGLSETISVKLLTALQYTVEVMRFFHNGWLGIKLVGVAAVDAIAQGLEFLFGGMRKLMLPLDAIFDGLVAIGAIDVNPFDQIEGKLGDFAWSSRDVTKQVLSDIESTNAAYDSIGTTIKGYIAQVQTTGAAHAAATAVVKTNVEQQSTAVSEAAAKAAAEQQKHLDAIEQKSKQATLSALEYKKWALEQEVAEMIKAANGNKKALDEIAAYKKAKSLEMMSYTDMYTSYERAQLERMKDSWQAKAEGQVDADQRAVEMIKEQETAAANVVAVQWDRAFESIQSAVATMVYEFDFSAAAIIDIVRRMLSEILAAILMSGIRSALLGLFNGDGLVSGLVSGITGALGLGSAGKTAGAAAGGLTFAGIGGKIAGWLGIGGTATAGAAGTAALAGGSGFVAGTGAGVGGAAATAAAGGTAASGGLGSLFSGGSMAGLGVAAAGIAAVIGLVSLLGRDSLPPVISQLNSMHVTAQQISAAGLGTEMQHITSEMQTMVPALRNVAIAAWDAGTATLSTRSAFDELQQSMSTGSGTIVEAKYRYDELTGTWQASLGVIDSYRQELYDAAIAANQATGAVASMGEATVTAAHRIAGAADSIGSLLDSARQTMVTAGHDGVSYHAAGFQVNSATRFGSHVIGERDPEALLPLPEGPDTMSKIIDRLDRIERRQSQVIVVNIAGTEVKRVINPMIDTVIADRQSSGATGRFYIS